MAQEIRKTEDDMFELDLSGDDLVIFFRVFGQEPEEAMRIAEIFETEPIAFAALSQIIRKQYLDQLNNEELFAAVAKLEKEAKEEN